MSLRVDACPMACGTGMKSKLLEATPCGAAISATPLALQKVSARDDRELLVTQSDCKVAEVITPLFCDRASGAPLEAAAVQQVQHGHTWAAIARTYEPLYHQVSRDRHDVPICSAGRYETITACPPCACVPEKMRWPQQWLGNR